MRFRSQRRSRFEAEISIVPLVDLFLNILVFFMVTTTFGAASAFFIDLPIATPGDSVGEQRQLAISVGASGELALGKERVSLSELEDKLRQIPQERRDSIPVVVRADRGALHGSVVSVLDAVRQAGLKNVGIVTKAPGSNAR